MFASSSWAPQRLHVRSSIVFLPVKFVVLKWFVVNITEHRSFNKYIHSRNSFQADFAAPRKRFRRNPGKVQPGKLGWRALRWRQSPAPLTASIPDSPAGFLKSWRS